jgi:predicted nucleotidyltransferase
MRRIRYHAVMDFVHPIAAVIPGAQGRVLGVLAETTAELNLRTLARLAGVSVAQASRVMPGLVELGLVERREVPPSSQFRLVRTHVAARAVLELAAARETMLADLGRAAAALTVSPASVIVFGSFARGEAGRDSDLDVVFVRPTGVDEDDDLWATSVEQWRTAVQTISGNPVEVLEVGMDEAATRLASDQPVWRDIHREGQVVHGLSLDELAGALSA